MTEIDAVDVRRLKIPLSEPYHLSHATVESFDVILFEVVTLSGRRGTGEVTPLTGYSRESGSEAWSRLTDVATVLPGLTESEARQRIEDRLDGYRFTRTAVDCALETAFHDPIESVAAPVVGITSTDIPAEQAVVDVTEQLEAGFETVKVKIGFDPETDAARLSEVVSETPGDIEFRVDANQGYTLEEARRFLAGVPTERLQLLEQPLPTGNLHDHATLHSDFEVPVMLDEEISSAADLEAVADVNAAGLVKFKLMKAGGWRTLQSLVRRANELDFGVVVGNGVQSDVACIYEAIIWQRANLPLAGEFNGWRKQRQALTSGGLQFQDGRLRWDGTSIEFEPDVVAQHTVERAQYGN